MVFTGWPAPDPNFPPNESLQWALRTSKELSDYKTQAILLEELICRVEDPRPLFNELDQLYGHAKGDLIQFYESLTSQYLLATDEDSCWELLQRLEAAASEFKPTPKDDVCAATRWNGLGVQNALARSISEEEELLEQNSELAKTLSEALPYSQKAIDNPRWPDPHEARGQVNDRFKEDISHRLHKLELELLKYKRQALEKELHDVRSRLELEKFENEEKPRAKKEEIPKPREDTSGRGLGFLVQRPSSSPEISYNRKDDPTGEQDKQDGHKVKLRQPEDDAVEDTIPLTHEPEEINYDTSAHENKEHQTSEKPYRYASVAEPQDEPTTLDESGQDPAEPSRSEVRGRQTTELQPETAQPQVTSELAEDVIVEESIGEESVHSADGSEEMLAHVREEVPSEDERPSRPPSSLGRSSKRDSQDLENRSIRMIGYSEEILD
ncbi:hypothetical protein PENSUB_971 [Penicillium subrubescens]|uniref:Uncharacterized protein n=1 Tax=Penicillium subrubescens TaxID=1316194 RepID=A0A1Q5ULN7_9EURO|nr:hypothetical protein PENSUB_971 [Penicillium subrubescens]